MPDLPIRLVADPPLRRVSRGSVSKPSDPRGTSLKRIAKDATPKSVSRGSVTKPRA